MILNTLTKKQFYQLAKKVLRELDEAQTYSDSNMTRDMYENTKRKYGLIDLEIEYMRKFRSTPFLLRCADGSRLTVNSPVLSRKQYSTTYDVNGDITGFTDSTKVKRNRSTTNPQEKKEPRTKSSLSIEEQLKVISDFNQKNGQLVKPTNKKNQDVHEE